MNQDQDQNQAPEQGEDLQPIVSLNSVMEMAEVLAKWHAHKVEVLRHMREIPDGSEVEIAGKTYVLTGEFRTAFQLGINTSLAELGTLPFVISTEDAPQNG